MLHNFGADDGALVTVVVAGSIDIFVVSSVPQNDDKPKLPYSVTVSLPFEAELRHLHCDTPLNIKILNRLHLQKLFSGHVTQLSSIL